MTDKAKQEVLLLRRLLQKNAPELYKIWSARKMAKYVAENPLAIKEKRVDNSNPNTHDARHGADM